MTNYGVSQVGRSAAQVDAAIAAALATIVTPDFLETYPPLATTAGSITANIVYMGRLWVPKAKTITQMAYSVGNNGTANVDLGVFSSSDLITWTLMASTGSTAAVGTNAVQWINLTAPFDLIAGNTYWLGFVASTSTITAVRTSATPAVDIRSRSLLETGSTIPLPASITTPIASGGALIWLAAA